MLLAAALAKQYPCLCVLSLGGLVPRLADTGRFGLEGTWSCGLKAQAWLEGDLCGDSDQVLDTLGFAVRGAHGCSAQRSLCVFTKVGTTTSLTPILEVDRQYQNLLQWSEDWLAYILRNMGEMGRVAG